MALLSLDQQSEAADYVRGIENDADRALAIISTLENCEDSYDLDTQARILRAAAESLLSTARALECLSAAAETDDLEECGECGNLCTTWDRDGYDGYCSRECAGKTYED